MEIIRKIENEKDRVASLIAEKNCYLGVYKERVLVALTKQEVEEKTIYKEVLDALDKKIAFQMVLLRTVETKYLKKYMQLADKYGVNCKLIDSLSLVGDIALVVCAKDSIGRDINPVVKSKLERFTEAGLPRVYYDCIGKKISKKYMDIIKQKVPQLADEYQQLSFLDMLFGEKCPIEEKLGGKIYG